jgi:hypothetical protein
MKLLVFHTAFVGFALATFGCGDGTAGSSAKALDNTPVAQNDRAAQDHATDTPLTVTGCLQKDGRTFIVTHLNEPAQKNAGSTGTSGAVGREQIRSASNAYRIRPAAQMDLDTLVGKQVKVNGTIEKRADLPSGSDKREDIGKGDLAELNATDVSIVAASCGGSGGR